MRKFVNWSESFLGDCVNFHAVCKYEEPIQSVALDVDWAKLSLFSNDGKYYWRPPIPSRSPDGMGYEYHFSKDSQVPGMVNWCLNNTCIMTIPKLSGINHVESLMLSKWKWGNENVMWTDVMEEEWQSEDNIKMVMKSGQALSLDGILGICHGVEVNDSSHHLVNSRLCNNRCARCTELTHVNVSNMVKHHAGEIVLHRMRNGNVLQPIFPRDL